MTTTAITPLETLQTNTHSGTVTRRGMRLIWGAAVLIILVSIARLMRVLPIDAQLDAASGVFSCLASDITRGEVYRPLYGSIGYGGTRYFPLHPACHAMLMKLGIDPINAGYGIAIAAAMALVSGAYLLMRRLGVTFSLAAPCAFFVLCTVSGQWAITTIRGDLLPAAMNVWGLAICAGMVERSGELSRRRFRPLLPALFFTLAFSGKMTTLFGAASVFFGLLIARRWKDAIRFAASMVLGLVIFFAVIQWASHGWFWRTMRLCADSDADLDTFSTAPIAMLLNTYRTDGGAILFWLLAVTVLLSAPKRIWSELPTLALVFTGMVTVAIFGTPGTAINHLIDLHVIAVVFFVVQISRGRLPKPLGLTILVVAVLLSLVGSIQSMRERDQVDRHARFASTLRQVRNVHGQCLFEIPTAPVIAGQRPYMSDPYMFAVIGTKRPEVAEEFLAKIDRREFGAIITAMDPANPGAGEWFNMAYFGRGFIEHVLANYELLPRTRGSDYIYVPKSATPSQAALPQN